MAHAPADRIGTLLLRADNVLENEGDPAARQQRARTALEEARVRELVERRLESLAALER